MRVRRFICTLAAGAAVLAACGGNDAGTGADQTTLPTETTAAAPAGSSVAVKSADSDLGQILVGPDGLTVYGFTNDKDGQSNCAGTCADAWPPVLVDETWTVGPGLDSAIFNAVTREDGTKQLVAGRWPLYYFSGDATPGDLKGQNSGGVWFVVATDGKLVEDGAGEGGEDEGDEAPAGISLGETSLGEVLVDADGLTLYAFTDDADGTPTCDAACADAWPPALADELPNPGEGIDPATLSLVERADGDSQLKAGKWPLYRFAGDAAPGDVNGQGSGGVWFAVRADGSLVRDGDAGGTGGSAGSTSGSGGTTGSGSTGSSAKGY
ncbi:MAG: hypothetical protein AB7L84_00830 [Acidimicrobiia bacterium]